MAKVKALRLLNKASLCSWRTDTLTKRTQPDLQGKCARLSGTPAYNHCACSAAFESMRRPCCTSRLTFCTFLQQRQVQVPSSILSLCLRHSAGVVRKVKWYADVGDAGNWWQHRATVVRALCPRTTHCSLFFFAT